MSDTPAPKKRVAKKRATKKAATKKGTTRRTTAKAAEPQAEPQTERTTAKRTRTPKPGFDGFAEPPEVPLPDSPQWPKRLTVLRDHYRGEWASYGPFTSESMARSSETTGKKNADKLGLEVETRVASNDDGSHLYIRVV